MGPRILRFPKMMRYLRPGNGRSIRSLSRAGSSILAASKNELPMGVRARLAWAHVLLWRGRVADALSAGRALEGTYPRASSVKALVAECLRRKDRPWEALEKAQEALEIASSPRALTIAGRAAVQAEEFSVAARHLSALVATRPSDMTFRGLLALCLARAGQPDEAIRVAEEALAINPSHRRLQAARVGAMIVAGRADEGLDALRRLLATGKVRNEDLYEFVWKTLVDAGRGDEALAYVDRIMQGEPHAQTLAKIALRLGRHEEAERHIREAIALLPDKARNYFLLSSALKGQFKIPEAREAIAQARRLRDDRRFVIREQELNALVAKTHAVELMRQKRFEAGLPEIEEAIRLNPADPRNHAVKGFILTGIGDLSSALVAVQEAYKLSDHPRIRLQRDKLIGTITTLSGDWLPPVPDEPGWLAPAAENRVLHILERTLPHRQSGYTVRTSYTLQAQKAVGLDPYVVTKLGFPLTDGVEQEDKLEIVDGVPHHRLLIPGMTEYARLPADAYLTEFTAGAAAVVEQVRPAFIQPASSYVNALVGLALKRHYGIPMVYEVRGFQEDSWTSRREKAGGTEFYISRYRTEAQCMKGADRVVTLAEVMKAEIAERGVNPERIHVIPNAVNVERFVPRPKNIDLVRSLGVEDRVVLGYISTLVPYEGVGTLLRAVKILLRRGAKVSGLVVGDGPELEPLRELAAELGIEEHMKLVGRVPHDDILDYYATIDVFVVPRRNLRVCNLVTPLKPFEAMAMERALLVSDVGALCEIVAPPERGLTFKAEDPESLAAEALRLVENPELRRKLGETARAWVSRERTWERNGSRYRELYDELLEERRVLLARR